MAKRAELLGVAFKFRGHALLLIFSKLMRKGNSKIMEHGSRCSKGAIVRRALVSPVTSAPSVNRPTLPSARRTAVPPSGKVSSCAERRPGDVV
jgi:hypothetical protein